MLPAPQEYCFKELQTPIASAVLLREWVEESGNRLLNACICLLHSPSYILPSLSASSANPGEVYEFLDFVRKRLCNAIDAKVHDVGFSGCIQILVENKQNILFYIPNIFLLMRLKWGSWKLNNLSSSVNPVKG